MVNAPSRRGAVTRLALALQRTTLFGDVALCFLPKAEGPEIGLAMVDDASVATPLAAYPYLHSTRADLLRRLGRLTEAADAYGRARALTTNEAEQRFLDGRLLEIGER